MEIKAPSGFNDKPLGERIFLFWPVVLEEKKSAAEVSLSFVCPVLDPLPVFSLDLDPLPVLLLSLEPLPVFFCIKTFIFLNYYY